MLLLLLCCADTLNVAVVFAIVFAAVADAIFIPAVAVAVYVVANFIPAVAAVAVFYS